jgi:uncharacterized protein YciI
MTKLFAISRAAGAGWDPARKLTEQDDWKAHASEMDALYEAGFVALAGPLGTPTFQSLMIVRANDEAEVRARFATDPWVVKDISRIVHIAQWQLRLGTLT